ncbi:MAG: WG repeat-containing protein [Bacteroidia bacterium]|nr:WG repeat-containing protein [Bacteroidia bacterium]
MAKKSLVIFTLLFASVLYSQRLIPYRKGNLWGYADSNGVMVIEPKYEYAGMEQCGLMLVKSHDKYGVIARDGSEVVAPAYQSTLFGCGSRYPSIIICRNPDGDYLFDRSGKFICKVDKVEQNHKSRYVVASKGKRIGLLSPTGSWRLRPTNLRLIRVTEGGGFISKGLFKTRYYNAAGRFKFSTRHRSSFDFYGGYSSITITKKTWRNIFKYSFRKYYGVESGKRVKPWERIKQVYHNLIDTNGRVLLPKGFNYEGMPRSGYVIGYGPLGRGLFDSLGNVLIEPVQRNINCDKNLICFVAKDTSRKFISFALGGKTEIPSQHKPNFNGKVYLVHSDNRSNLVDMSGKKLFEQDFDFIISGYDDSAFCAKRNDKLYWINEHGHVVLEADTHKYSTGFPFEKGQALVSKNGLYGMIDQVGQVIIPLKYYRLQRLLHDAYIIGTSPDRFNPVNGLMRLSGALLLDTVYRAIYLSNQKTHIIAANKDRLMGLYDLMGNRLLPEIYSNIVQWPDKFFTLQMPNPNYKYSENTNIDSIIGFQVDPDGKNLIRLPGNSGQKGYFLYNHIEKGWVRYDGKKFYED